MDFSDVSGEQLIFVLGAYVTQFGDKIIGGSRQLSLSTSYLRFLCARLRERKRKKSTEEANGPKSKEKRGLFSFFSSTRKEDEEDAVLDSLMSFLGRLEHLKVTSTEQEPSELDLSFFGNLRTIELHNCDIFLVQGGRKMRKVMAVASQIDFTPFVALKAVEMRNCEDRVNHRYLQYLVSFLEELEAHKTVTRCQDLLRIPAALLAPDCPVPIWARLRILDLSDNGLVELDESLSLVPALEEFTAHHNEIKKVEFLGTCARLHTVDLSHNRIFSLSGVHLRLSFVRKLILSHNLLATTQGLDGLMWLQYLDLSHNQLSSWLEIARLSHIPCLSSLHLQGNPLSALPKYRLTATTIFRGRAEFSLDGKAATKSELAGPPAIRVSHVSNSSSSAKTSRNIEITPAEPAPGMEALALSPRVAMTTRAPIVRGPDVSPGRGKSSTHVRFDPTQPPLLTVQQSEEGNIGEETHLLPSPVKRKQLRKRIVPIHESSPVGISPQQIPSNPYLSASMPHERNINLNLNLNPGEFTFSTRNRKLAAAAASASSNQIPPAQKQVQQQQRVIDLPDFEPRHDSPLFRKADALVIDNSAFQSVLTTHHDQNNSSQQNLLASTSRRSWSSNSNSLTPSSTHRHRPISQPTTRPEFQHISSIADPSSPRGCSFLPIHQKDVSGAGARTSVSSESGSGGSTTPLSALQKLRQSTAKLGSSANSKSKTKVVVVKHARNTSLDEDIFFSDEDQFAGNSAPPDLALARPLPKRPPPVDPPTTPSLIKSGQQTTPQSPSQEFLNKIDQLKKEGGSSWLLIYNEMQGGGGGGGGLSQNDPQTNSSELPKTEETSTTEPQNGKSGLSLAMEGETAAATETRRSVSSVPQPLPVVVDRYGTAEDGASSLLSSSLVSSSRPKSPAQRISYTYSVEVFEDSQGPLFCVLLDASSRSNQHTLRVCEESALSGVRVVNLLEYDALALSEAQLPTFTLKHSFEFPGCQGTDAVTTYDYIMPSASRLASLSDLLRSELSKRSATLLDKVSPFFEHRETLFQSPQALALISSKRAERSPTSTTTASLVGAASSSDKKKRYQSLLFTPKNVPFFEDIMSSKRQSAHQQRMGTELLVQDDHMKLYFKLHLFGDKSKLTCVPSSTSQSSDSNHDSTLFRASSFLSRGNRNSQQQQHQGLAHSAGGGGSSGSSQPPLSFAEKGEEEEGLIDYVYCNMILGQGPLGEEISAVIVVSDYYIYFLEDLNFKRRSASPSESSKGGQSDVFPVLRYHQVSSLSTVTMGYKHAYIRLEFSDGASYCIISRSCSTTKHLIKSILNSLDERASRTMEGERLIKEAAKKRDSTTLLAPPPSSIRAAMVDAIGGIPLFTKGDKLFEQLIRTQILKPALEKHNSFQKEEEVEPVSDSSLPIDAYFMFYLPVSWVPRSAPRQEGGRPKNISFGAEVLPTSIYPARHVGKLRSISIILSDRVLYFCEESYSLWPSVDPSDSTPYFKLIACERLSDLQSLVKYQPFTNQFGIVFEGDETGSRKWTLVAADVDTRDSFLNLLCKEWYGIFHVELEVKEKKSNY